MISTIVLLLAMSKYQSASAMGIEPITDSVTVTPIVTTKLIARSFIGQDITIYSKDSGSPSHYGKGLGVRFLVFTTAITH
jgi:L-lactate utilization protein LutB